MHDRVYRLTAGLLDVFLWGGELVDGENLPHKGPVVFVANHLGALGPVAVIASLPVRVYPWVIADMLDRELAPAYLNQDFMEPELHLRPPHSLWLAKQISRISVPLLQSAGCVPVYQGDKLLETYRISVDLLVAGKSLLVFPEDPDRSKEITSRMTPFKVGFARLGEQYYARTACLLQFCPLAVHAESYRVRAGVPIAYNANHTPRVERFRIKSVLEADIRRMMLETVMNQFPGIPLRP